jgi:DNA-binding response OmpR family regulator
MAHVLIVDDSRQLALTLADYVESQGYHVTTASNGREGPPALVALCDHPDSR